MDEKSKQLIADTRVPISMQPGKPQRIDYEYKRNGTRNIFVAVEPLGGKHIIKVTKRRTRKDFAVFIKELVTRIYRQAKKINLVLDNLNIHFAKSLYEAFPERRSG
jgi:predicted transcriptional regulator